MDKQKSIKEKQKIFEWKAPEYEFREKSADWFWIVAIISSALITASIVFDNFLFAVIIFIAAFSLMLYGARKPKEIKISITEKGITIDDRFYDFSELKSFWIEKTEEKTKLLLKTKSLVSVIDVELREDEDKIRDFLRARLKEEEIEEPLSFTLARLIGL